jgi:hypothetical protein
VAWAKIKALKKYQLILRIRAEYGRLVLAYVFGRVDSTAARVPKFLARTCAAASATSVVLVIVAGLTGPIAVLPVLGHTAKINSDRPIWAQSAPI